MNKTITNIKGMHCRSCELLVEDELLKITGVKKVLVNQQKGIAEISYIANQLKHEDIKLAVQKAGYELSELNKEIKKPFISQNLNDYTDLIIAVIIFFIIFFVLNDLGFFKKGLVSSNNYSNFSIVFLIGLTAGLSTCMALVGGLVLGASARFSEKHPNSTSLQKFKPHLFFNLGRILGFFILGGLIGYLGSFFQFSPSILGLLTIFVGLVMLLLGAQLIHIFPRLNNFTFTLPKSLSRLLGLKHHSQKEYSHKNSMLLGALTFFLPCGFTQAMQLYAISSRNGLTGALTMGIFALGTAPGLLGVGGLTSVIKGVFAKKFFKFAGLVVIFLGFFNISNGYNLTGFNFKLPPVFSQNFKTQTIDSNVTLKNGVQIVRMTQNFSGYEPNSFTIKKDTPVKWIITSENPNSCAASIVSSKLGIRQSLEAGENIIEFTPKETGEIRFSCSMGMYTGLFNIIDTNDSKKLPTNLKNNQLKKSNSVLYHDHNGGCSCCGGK